ncbi:Type 1 glutamine amidotransferase-like domain-containing protein [Xylanimonas protaetiae]|uniref:Peptidase E n=1 Tax=Xylanimonas protaetiae TaxID=2509457 RepID=A0A4P6F3M9_9MICO|nr:Type 1 glutamine amidotransferase-like domain-containing protein [Xylanimonas protaetiae]QAY70490.1 peptidase E [Xylanimonas protaetiae]
MKYLLTSSGISNPSIHAALVDLLGKPIDECSALVIPTAAYWFSQGPDIAYGLITGATQRLTAHGWKSVGVLELTALPSIAADAWVPRVRETDVLLVGGGDPMYLCRWLRESGFADLMPTLDDDAVWVGTSAGSMAVTASFGENYNDRPVPTTGTETPLGLVDIAIYPHLDHPAMEDTAVANVAAWAQGVPVPAYGIDDSTAIRVVDGTLEVVSEGHWELFEDPGRRA